MSPKDFLLKFILIVAVTLLGVYASNYLEIKSYNQKPSPDHAVTLPSGESSGSDVPAVAPSGTETETPSVSDVDSPADANKYSVEKYPVSHAESGSLKNISADSSAIVVVDDAGVEHRVVITDSTEVFRYDKRVELSEIKETDRITVLGRKRSEDSDEFVADSIHAAEIIDHPVPVVPLEHNGDN